MTIKDEARKAFGIDWEPPSMPSKEHQALLDDLITAIRADTLRRIERELGIAQGLRNFAREQLDYWTMQLAYSAEEIKIYGNEKARRKKAKQAGIL